MKQEERIRPKDRDSVLQSLRAGVVPRMGLHLIQVGRIKEVQALITDIDRIVDGGSSIRFIIGDYGAGKTFFLHLIRSIALEKGLVTVHADLTPDRRIHATANQARNLYAELMRNIATRTKPDGGALSGIVERFVTTVLSESRESGKNVELIIQERMEHLNEMVGGYDFAQVITCYWKGHDGGNEQLKSNAVRWLRAEFSTKTDARNALGVRTIVDDDTVYDHLKLMARFTRLAGYNGLLVGLDELVNLYKLSNTQARNVNYEQILRILNDSLQGIAVGLGFLMCGTPDFLMDPRRGLYSYPALQSRLQENSFAKNAGVVDYTAPVIRLANLTQEDLYILLQKIRHVFASGDSSKYLLPDGGLNAFMEHCLKKIGEAYFRTPRTTIRSFVDLLSVLEQNPRLEWQNLIGEVKVEADIESSEQILSEDESQTTNGASQVSSTLKNPDTNIDDDLTTFKL